MMGAGAIGGGSQPRPLTPRPPPAHRHVAQVSVTKKLSGAARATIDACRTLFVWFFCLWAGWERFHLLQVVGFVILLSGTSTYNEILRSCLPAQGPSLPQHRRHRRSSEEEGAQEPLLGREGRGRRPPPRTGSAAGREEEAAGSPGFSFAPDAGQQQQQLEHLPTRAARPPLPARPRPISSHMSMARCAALSAPCSILHSVWGGMQQGPRCASRLGSCRGQPDPAADRFRARPAPPPAGRSPSFRACSAPGAWPAHRSASSL